MMINKEMMMMKIIQAPMILHDLKRAQKLASTLNGDESDDWSYVVVDCENGMGRIDAYDEDGVLVHRGL